MVRKSPEHVRRHRESLRVRRIRSLDGHLESKEVEQAIAHDGSANGSAELILFETVSHQGRRAAAVEKVITRVLEEIAVNGVRARARRHRDGRGRMLTALRAYGTGLHLEFLQRIRERQRLIQSVERIVGSTAIER